MVVGEERHGEVRKEERGGERGERENAKWGSATGWEMQNGKKDIEIHIGLESFIDIWDQVSGPRYSVRRLIS
jgi:hypothetical protein